MGNALECARIVAEILKSLHTPKPKKEKQVMVPVHVSLRNPLRTRLTMEEKGKTINIETDEEDLEDLIIENDEDEGMKEETEPVYLPTKLPTYISLQKGKAKALKDLDESKSLL